MDVCSSFMAAPLTSRYTTSGHLTSLGMEMGGGGAGPVRAEPLFLRFLHSPSVEDNWSDGIQMNVRLHCVQVS